MQQSKRARALSYSAAVLLGGLVAFGGDAKAQDSPNFGQFLAGKSSGDSSGRQMMVFNPTPFEMIALAIDFDDDDGTFDSCTGAIIDPFGTDDETISDGFSGDRGTLVVISVPTSNEGKIAGKIKKNIGLVAGDRKKKA